MGNKNHSYYRMYEKYTINDGVKTVYKSTNLCTNVRVADDNPNYKDLIRKKVNATNRLTAEYNTVRLKTSYCSVMGKTGSAEGKVYETTTANPSPVKPVTVDETKLALALTTAATQLNKKILAEQQSFAGPQFLGELREAVKMVKHPAQTLSKQINDYHKQLKWKTAKFRDLKAKRKVIADSWLEACFGWAPLLSDIGSIAESALQRCELNPIKRVTAIGEESADLVQIKNRTGGIASIYYDYEERQTSKRTVYLRAGVKAHVDRGNTGIERVIDSSGLDNWLNAVPTAWELLPFSFLVDYFTNVGDMINSAFTSTANVAWSNRTTVTENKRQTIGIRHTYTAASYTLLNNRNGHAVATTRLIERVPAPVPIPGLRFELPESNFKLSIIAALLTGLT